MLLSVLLQATAAAVGVSKLGAAIGEIGRAHV